MKSIHFIMQGKGGVGKTLCASLLAQYFKEQNLPLFCFDTDPVNGSFSHYKALNVEPVEIINKANTAIDGSKFDIIIESIKNAPENSQVIVDSGASTFHALHQYLVENSIVSELPNIIDEPVQAIWHCPITGGAAEADTVIGADFTIRQLQAPTVLWLNGFFGELPKKHYSEWNVFKGAVDFIKGAVTLKRQNVDTFGKDIEKMCKLGLTFQEVDQSNLALMSKHRLRLFKNDIFTQLDSLFGTTSSKE